MNRDLMFSSITDQWATPLDFFQELNKEFDFNLDPCADSANHKCEKYFTTAENGLLQNWGGTESFVIHLTEELSNNGLKKLMKKATKRTPLFVC